MDTIKIAVIGVGNIGSVHARHIADGKVSGLKLAALCDTNPKRRELLEQEYPEIPVYCNHKELLESQKTEAVIVATPHYFHPIIAADSFEAGQHVLIEKPAGVYTSMVCKMNEAAKRSGKIFGIMFNQRTDPLFIKAREIVKSGQLGSLKRLVWIVTNWYRTQAYYDSGAWRATWNGEGGGVLINQAPHNLDLWQWIFGMPKRLRAFCSVGKYHHIAVEDDATIYAEYENGAVSTFITTTGEAPGTNRLEISGDRGKLVLEDGKLHWWKLSVPERQFCFTSKEDFYQPSLEKKEYVMPAPEEHHLILKNFADAILNHAPLLAPGEEGINSLSLSNAAYLSTWTDDWVEFPFDEKKFQEELEKRCQTEQIAVKTDIEKERFLENYQERWNVRW